jgi:hypothetical protein
MEALRSLTDSAVAVNELVAMMQESVQIYNKISIYA